MSIIDKKEMDDFDKEVQKYLSYSQLPGMQITLKGSAQYKHLHYKSDYDVLISVKKDAPPTKVFNDLKTVLQNIEQDPDTYFIELELQSKSNEKVRFYHGDVFSYSDFEKAYGDMAFFKVGDMVMLVKSKLFEASCVCKMTNDDTLTRENIMKKYPGIY